MRLVNVHHLSQTQGREKGRKVFSLVIIFKRQTGASFVSPFLRNYFQSGAGVCKIQVLEA